MTAIVEDIQALELAVKRGVFVQPSTLLELVQILNEKTDTLEIRQSCYKIIVAASKNRQNLPEEVFVALVEGVSFEEELNLKKVASYVLMSCLTDRHQQKQPGLVCQDNIFRGLHHVLQNENSLQVKTLVACAIPYVMSEKTESPEFLELYLQDALTDARIQPYAKNALELLTPGYSESDVSLEDTEDTTPIETQEQESQQQDAEVVKSLEDLLQELKNTNADLAILKNNHLLSQLQAVKATSKGISELLPTQPSIENWNAQTVAMWINALKENPQKACHPTFQAEMIAVLCVGRQLATQQQLRDVQLLSLLILLSAKEKGIVAQIITGEGKTTIVAMLAAFKVLQKQKVDIVSSSAVLAHRDAESERKFFDVFGITVADTAEPKENYSYQSGFKKCYIADVVYGDIAFLWDALRSDYLLEGTRGSRPYENVIVDEVDSMLIEEGTKLALLGGCKPAMEQLQPLLMAAWTKLSFENTPDHFIEENGHLFWRTNTESEKIEIQDRLTSLEDILEAQLVALITEKDSPILIPNHLKQFALNQAKYWAQSAVMASEKLQLGRDYVLSENEEKQQTIAPVDRMNTGVTQVKTAWNNGLHQFLQIKHGLTLTPETITTSYMSNDRYFNRYSTNIYGVTGTLGGKDSQSLLTQLYPIDLAFIPTYKPKELTMNPGILAETHEDWLHAIVETTKQATLAGRSALVICESILDVDEVDAALKAAGIEKLRRYSRSDHDEKAKLMEPMSAGEVMVATSLAGRGTDLKTTIEVKQNQGLHVCLTYLPNQRGRDQAFGRTARQGEKGSAQLIVDKSALEAKLKPRYFLLGQADSMEHALEWRDQVEAARLEEFQSFELKKMKFQDTLFERFSQLMSRLRAIENNKNRLADIEEQWGFWLKTIDNQIVSTHCIDEDAILKSYLVFEKQSELAFQQYDIHNPGHWIHEGNRLFRNSADGANIAAAYQKAIDLDPVFSLPGYYGQARQACVSHQGNYKETVLINLRAAGNHLENHLIPQARGVQIMYGVSQNKTSRMMQPDLSRQHEDKIVLLEKIKRNIDDAIHVIEHTPGDVQIRQFKSLSSLFPFDEPLEEISALQRMGLTHLIELEAVPKKKKKGFFGAFIVGLLGAIELGVGICLTLSGQVSLGGFFICEGLGDMVYAACCMRAGEFRWENYGVHKGINLAISAVTWGIDAIKTSMAEKAANAGKVTVKTIVSKKLSQEALVQIAKDQVVHGLVAIGIHEGANALLNAASRHTLANFKDEIEKHVSERLQQAFQDPDFQQAIDTLLSLDQENKNQQYEFAIQNVSNQLAHSKRNRVATIVSSIMDGVLARQHAALAALKTLGDIAHAVPKLTEFTDQFCDELKRQVRFMAHKVFAGRTITIDQNYCTEHRETLCRYMVNDVRGYLISALHREAVRPAMGTAMHKKLSTFTADMQQAVRQTYEPMRFYQIEDKAEQKTEFASMAVPEIKPFKNSFERLERLKLSSAPNRPEKPNPSTMSAKHQMNFAIRPNEALLDPKKDIVPLWHHSVLALSNAPATVATSPEDMIVALHRSIDKSSKRTIKILGHRIDIHSLSPLLHQMVDGYSLAPSIGMAKGVKQIRAMLQHLYDEANAVPANLHRKVDLYMQWCVPQLHAMLESKMMAPVLTVAKIIKVAELMVKPFATMAWDTILLTGQPHSHFATILENEQWREQLQTTPLTQAASNRMRSRVDALAQFTMDFKMASGPKRVELVSNGLTQLWMIKKMGELTFESVTQSSNFLKSKIKSWRNYPDPYFPHSEVGPIYDAEWIAGRWVIDRPRLLTSNATMRKEKTIKEKVQHFKTKAVSLLNRKQKQPVPEVQSSGTVLFYVISEKEKLSIMKNTGHYDRKRKVDPVRIVGRIHLTADGEIDRVYSFCPEAKGKAQYIERIFSNAGLDIYGKYKESPSAGIRRERVIATGFREANGEFKNIVDPPCKNAVSELAPQKNNANIMSDEYLDLILDSQRDILRQHHILIEIDGYFLPKVCRTAEGYLENKLLIDVWITPENQSFYQKQKQIVDAYRYKYEKQFSLLEKTAWAEFKALTNHLTKESRNALKSIFLQVMRFRETIEIALYAIEMDYLNCGEQSACALIDELIAFNREPRTQPTQKIHLIHLYSQRDDHAFIVSGSTTLQETISNNPVEIANFLRNMDGTIIDYWNNPEAGGVRLPAKIAREQFVMYGPEASQIFDRVKIEEYSTEEMAIQIQKMNLQFPEFQKFLLHYAGPSIAEIEIKITRKKEQPRKSFIELTEQHLDDFLNTVDAFDKNNPSHINIVKKYLSLLKPGSVALADCTMKAGPYWLETVWNNGEIFMPDFRRMHFELIDPEGAQNVVVTFLEGPTLPDTYQYVETIWEVENKQATAKFSYVQTKERELYVYLHYIEGVEGASIGRPTETHGTLLHFLSTCQNLAKDAGVEKLFLQLQPSNERLGLLLRKKYPQHSIKPYDGGDYLTVEIPIIKMSLAKEPSKWQKFDFYKEDEDMYFDYNKPFHALSVSEIRNLPHYNEVLMYVITLDEEVIITEQIYDHSMLGRGEPVLVAGDVYLKKVNGVLQIERIDNRSGSYMSEIFLDENYPKNIAHLPHLVESKFIEIGFLEAKGKYQEFLTPEQQLSFLLEKAEEDFESLSSKEKAYVNKLKSHASSEEVPLLKREMEPYSKFNFFRSGTTPNSSVIAPKITLKID